LEGDEEVSLNFFHDDVSYYIIGNTVFSFL